MRFSTILTVLFCPFIAHERTAQNLILSVRSMRFALFLKERHRSQNQASLKSDVPISEYNTSQSTSNKIYFKKNTLRKSHDTDLLTINWSALDSHSSKKVT